MKLSRNRAWVWTVAALAVLAVVVGVLLARGGAQPEQTASSPAAPTLEPSPSRSSVPPVTLPSITPSRQTDSGAGERPELAPAAPRDSVEGEDGVRVAITKIEQVQAEAVQPGETAGPALRVTVTITNAGNGRLDTSRVVVNGYYGAERTPAGTAVQPGGVPFAGDLETGQTTYGVYLFTIPADQQSNAMVTVDYRVSEAVVVFEGDFAA